MMSEFDRFGRKITRVNVNWKHYMVPEYKVGDLIQSRYSKTVVGVVTDVLKNGELRVDFTSDEAPTLCQDYDVILISPVDNQ